MVIGAAISSSHNPEIGRNPFRGYHFAGCLTNRLLTIALCCLVIHWRAFLWATESLEKLYRDLCRPTPHCRRILASHLFLINSF